MRRRTTTTAVLTASALAATVLGGPSVAATTPAVPSAATAASETPFAWGPGSGGLVADDAVYWGFDFQRTTIYRSPLTHGLDTTAFGEGELVGRTFMGAPYAEHEGTLAYVRAVDGQLVLRTADGTETLPVWGEDAGLRGGIEALTDRWVVGRSGVEWDLDNDYTLYDRATGEAYDLDGLVERPTGFTEYGENGLTLTDDLLLWSDWSVTEDWHDRTAVHTVALGPDGPFGSATLLDAATGHPDEPGSYRGGVGGDGTRVVWVRGDFDGGTGTTAVRWLDAPYSGVPGVLTIDAAMWTLDDGALVLQDAEAGQVTWTDLDAPTTPVRTIDVRDDVLTVGNGIVMHQSYGDIVIYLTDATGGALTGDTGHYIAPSFSDVYDDDAFGDEIMWLAQYGIVGGYDDGTYRNRAPVNRDAMAAFLYRTVHGDPPAPACTEAPFADVPVTHPFCGEIAWLADTGISTGWADGTYRPAQPISREAMAAFLYRLSEGTAVDPACGSAPFSDVATGSPFCGEIAWLAETGVTTGWPDGTFRPGALIERQAMAAFLFRAIDAGLV